MFYITDTYTQCLHARINTLIPQILIKAEVFFCEGWERVQIKVRTKLIDGCLMTEIGEGLWLHAIRLVASWLKTVQSTNV